mmetsp:Transcript_60201/g.125935  ORF Transcript_60201/g.125935 Transcript_60201/m.125935 type:complete len:192 (+) Transcript_60201:1122-1697(+)
MRRDQQGIEQSKSLLLSPLEGNGRFERKMLVATAGRSEHSRQLRRMPGSTYIEISKKATCLSVRDISGSCAAACARPSGDQAIETFILVPLDCSHLLTAASRAQSKRLNLYPQETAINATVSVGVGEVGSRCLNFCVYSRNNVCTQTGALGWPGPGEVVAAGTQPERVPGLPKASVRLTIRRGLIVKTSGW